MTASQMYQQLLEAIESARNLPSRDFERFTDLLANGYGYAMHDDPRKPPLGIEVSLSTAGVLKTLFEEMTGDQLDNKD